MNNNGTADFSAADSALGYIFQCRLALLLALRRIRSGDEFLLSLETLDDVVFEQEGKPPELLQLDKGFALDIPTGYGSQQSGVSSQNR